jgi:hypothetical protein
VKRLSSSEEEEKEEHDQVEFTISGELGTCLHLGRTERSLAFNVTAHVIWRRIVHCMFRLIEPITCVLHR